MPKKKTNDCPLFRHQNRQWAKKIRGKLHYFGTDKQQALERWADERDYLMAGRVPPKKDASPALAELANVYLARCRDRVSSGELAERSATDYLETLGRMIGLLGAECRIEHFRPLDFGRLREQLAEPVARDGNKPGRVCTRRSPVTVSGDVRRIRAFLRWAADSELIAPPRFGREFSPAAQKTLRRQRAIQGRQDLSADEIRRIIESASVQFRPVLLLGVNCAMGAGDVAEVRRREIPTERSDGVMVSLPRRKTGAPRRAWIWPETIAAIDEYLRAFRRDPKPDERLLLTRSGLPWVRVETSKGRDGTTKARRQDSATSAFTKARTAAGVDHGTFYALRKSFRTEASRTLDEQAVRLCMGHTDQSHDMDAAYIQHIDDDRIRRVCSHVRAWLFGGSR